MVKPNKCSVSIALARATIDPKATMAMTISNIGFTISVGGDFTVCGSPDCLDVDRLGCHIFAPCDTSGSLARIGHARGDVESSIIPRESITASLAGRRRSKAAVPA